MNKFWNTSHAVCVHTPYNGVKKDLTVLFSILNKQWLTKAPRRPVSLQSLVTLIVLFQDNRQIPLNSTQFPNILSEPAMNYKLGSKGFTSTSQFTLFVPRIYCIPMIMYQYNNIPHPTPNQIKTIKPTQPNQQQKAILKFWTIIWTFPPENLASVLSVRVIYLWMVYEYLVC